MSYLPISVLDGLFLFMGIASFGGNSFYQRIVLYITDKERQYARSLDFLDQVPASTVRHFTLVQMLILAAIFAITRVPFIDGFFPLLIAVLVPVRIAVLPAIFGSRNVDLMDATGSAPDEDDYGDKGEDDAPSARAQRSCEHDRGCAPASAPAPTACIAAAV